MRRIFKIAAVATVIAGSTALATVPASAASSGGHVGGGGFHGGGFHGAVGHGWGGWHGGWGGWRGGWGCCGWGYGWGWGFGLGLGLWASPWYWGPDVAYVDPYAYDYGPPPPAGDNYGAPPPSNGSYGPPPGASDNYNCSAWRWDDAAKKYVQVRAACN